MTWIGGPRCRECPGARVRPIPDGGSPSMAVIFKSLQSFNGGHDASHLARGGFGPARASSAPLVGNHADLGIAMAPHMPTDPENSKNTFFYNFEFWADYRDDLDAKFQAWLAQ